MDWFVSELGSKPDSTSLPDLARADERGTAARARHHDNAYPLLDLMRFGAALLVMLAHLRDQYFMAYGDTQAGSKLLKTAFFLATRLGMESVLLFFVLSGFLVGGISLDKAVKGRFSPVKYAIDRFTRIYTPLVPVLIFALLICLTSGMAFSWGNFLVNLASLQGVFGDPFPASGALWSLSYEVWFYILCGALLCLVRPGTQRWKLVFLLLLVLSGFVFSRLMPGYLFVWVAGAGSYFLGKPKRPLLFLVPVLTLVGLGVVLVQVTSNTTQMDFSAFRFIDKPMAILTLGLGLALLVPLAAQLQLTSSWGIRLGDAGAFCAGFSYSLYLIHLPMEELLLNQGLLHRHNVLNAATLAGYCGTALGMLLVSYAFYFCFERQTPLLRKWLHRLVGQ
jgi:peptidoglycan/LPS O-acetylase OafA/YrhL